MCLFSKIAEKSTGPEVIFEDGLVVALLDNPPGPARTHTDHSSGLEVGDKSHHRPDETLSSSRIEAPSPALVGAFGSAQVAALTTSAAS
jgi:hypothetical protein